MVACTKTNGGVVDQQHIAPDRPSGRSNSERLYTAVLPRLLPGDRMDYRLELRRSGQSVASLPPDGSWLTLLAPEPVSTAPAEGPAPVASDGVATPRWNDNLTFFGTLAVDLRAEVVGYTPDGFQVNFFAREGHLRGPRISAEEVEGAEYVCVRPDGIGVHTKRVTWRTLDGAIILEDAYGLTDLGPDGYRKIAEGPWTGTPSVTAAATWSTAHPDWQWLNRVQTMAIGRTFADTLHVELDAYLLTVADH
jgi:hypothetical protein